MGLVVTLYAVHVEQSAGPQYRSMCDINDHISCSRVLTSPYTRMMGMIFNLPKDHMFNLPNTNYGVLFYLAICCYPWATFVPGREFLLLGASVFSLVACCGLAYILYFKLKDLCLVCISSYVVNLFIFYYALKENKLF